MGMHEEYARRKHGGHYEMPEFMREALKETYGVVTYQEQAMNLSKLLSGFTGPEANRLRKAIGKKLEDLMAEMKMKFINGAKPRIDAGEISEEEVVDIWSQLESFAGYAFNKSHAVSYSAVTTVELWLKYHYPVEYVAALANNTKQGKKKSSIGVSNLLVHYLNYGRKRGFEVLPPCVNNSKTEFTIEDGQVRFSLEHVKKVASNAEHIVRLAPYDSISDFYEKCVYETPVKTGKNAGKMRTTRPNKGVVEALVASGAFDSLAPDGLETYEKRNALLAEYYSAKKGKKEEPPEYTSKQCKSNEVSAIGLCLSEPPILKQWQDLIDKKGWMTIDEDMGDRKKVTMFGQVMGIRAHTSKKGNSMHIVTFSDGIDSIDFFVFEGGRQYFFDNCKAGQIVAMPLSKFEDGNTRFFDEYREPIIVAS
jgi:DNA polymerase-3 subunit alpha